MITDVSRLRLHLCTIITSTAPTQIVGENAEPRVRRLTGDIRAKNKNIRLKLFVNREVSSCPGGDFGGRHYDTGWRIEAQVLLIINGCISGV